MLWRLIEDGKLLKYCGTVMEWSMTAQKNKTVLGNFMITFSKQKRRRKACGYYVKNI